MRKKILMLGVLGIFIGLGVYFILIQLKGDETDKKPEIVEQEIVYQPTEEDVLGDDVVYKVSSISVSDRVVADEVKLAIPGYVVVFSDDDGEIDEVLGSSLLLPEGVSKKVKIELKRKLLRGEVVYVGLHSDDGDSVFEYPGLDIPFHTRGSIPVRKRFVVKE